MVNLNPTNHYLKDENNAAILPKTGQQFSELFSLFITFDSRGGGDSVGCALQIPPHPQSQTRSK